MKKQRVLALLLCLALLCTLIPGVFAANDNASSKGMEISKTATANSDGTYTVTLEAYATGSKIISEVKKDIPTDIVLVLDQSGSMDDPIGTVGFEPYEDESYNGYVYAYHTRNQDHYENRHNGGDANLWYKADDGKYYSVSVTVKQNVTYTEIATSRTNSYYYNNTNNLYAKIDDKYLKVTVTRTGNMGNRTYTYTLPDGTEIAKENGNNASPKFTGIDGENLFLASVDDSQNFYTYTYTDANGDLQTIDTSTGANTTFSTTLYQRVVNTNAGDSRLNALKTAVTTFADSVAEKAKGEDGVLGTTDDVNHRIAVVGYASRADSSNPWINTEVFIGANQYNYNDDASSYYGSAFQNMDTTQGQENVTASIGALDANGATYTNYGLKMANGILDANPVQDGKARNRVIILFTDGYPGRNADDFNAAAADSALTQATIAKNDGVSVYSVGIFSGADATSAGNKNGTNIQAANWFMQQVSSNNGTPQSPSYYLSAGDAGTLNNIFQQISNQIESGGSSTTLGSQTVIKDIISPAFELPAGATADSITLETYACTGKDSDGNYTWSNNNNTKGATATVSGGQVSVTSFDFAENYVGTVTENGNVTYRGNKLVISFTVTPKSGFLGGNNVYTNTSAGVYENSSATTPVLTFDRPQVNVPIKDVTVTAAYKNVYLLGSVTGAQLKAGATVKVGDVALNLDLSADNYGLADWQTEYVDINVEIKDKDGNAITDKLSDLKDDTIYSISVTVAPKETANATSSGTPAVAKSGANNPAAKINVFKPKLTFKDGEAWYGDDVPTGVNSNLTETKWLHGTDEADTTKMGDAPALTLSGTPDSTKIENGKINTKQDVPVDVAVKIGETDVTGKTTFAHTSCTEASINCSWNETTLDGSPAFLLHVKTCKLTVTKIGGAADEPYVFTVKKDGTKYTEVTVEGNGSVTICELPVGTYTIEEDTGWSWRYSADDDSSVTLSAGNPTGSITCTNRMEKFYWLNGFSEVETNIFGISK